MQFFDFLTGKTTRFLMLALPVGLLFCLNSCMALRSMDVPAETKPEPEVQMEISLPEFAEKMEKNKETVVWPAYERSIPAQAQEWIDRYEHTYGIGSSSRVLLNAEDIHTANRLMLSQTPSLHDLSVPPKTMRGTEIRRMIESHSMPSGEQYADGRISITEAMRTEILQNRNLDELPETVIPKPAVITIRADLKRFPTNTTFHKIGDTYYDGIQETELIVGTPAVILHTSADGAFFFVMTSFYSGWIPSAHAAFCSAEEYRLFAVPDTEMSVTVLAKIVDCGGIRLDMGSILPCADETADSYTVLLPKRHPGTGKLVMENAEISKNSAIRGYLDYTMENYYRQAFLYLGTEYGWGGANGGIDCSGFVCAVFRTFGLNLPRNTGDQSQYAGTILSLASDPSGVLDTINQPAAIYRPGHVMLYLGKIDGTHYIIHAPQGGEKVCVAPLSMAKLTGVSVFIK